MNMKKKLVTGVLAGTLGLLLVTGGTYAAFNDVETVNNTFTAGTLNLSANTDVLFNVSDLKPGDSIKKTITLTNKGSLAINELLVTSSAAGFVEVEHENLPDNGVNSKEEFLSQFEVKVGNDVGTLNDLSSLAHQAIVQLGDDGIPVLQPSESITIDIVITFKEDNTRYEGSKLFEQNKFQGESIDINLIFEATQMPGEDRS